MVEDSVVEQAARTLYDHDFPDTAEINRDRLWHLRRDDYLPKAQALADQGLLAGAVEVVVISDEFDPIAWCAQEVERAGNRLATLLTGEVERDRQEYIILHSAVGQLAQVLRALRGAWWVKTGSGAGPVGCTDCGHPPHGGSECGVVVGYDHLNGDHECGCEGRWYRRPGDSPRCVAHDLYECEVC